MGTIYTDPVVLRVEEEVAPVWIGLHEPEFKQLPHYQIQHSKSYLQWTQIVGYCMLHNWCEQVREREKRSRG